MAWDLHGRVAFITGAKRIGAVVADALAAKGTDVVVGYRGSVGPAERAAQAVAARGRRALALRLDVSDATAVQSAVDHVVDSFGRLDILINMASLYRKVAFETMTSDDWRTQLAVDLDGTFNVARAAAPAMRRTGGGRIVNFTDWVAASGRPRYRGYVAYYVAKAGVKALTEALALELASDDILVNAIAPGPILAPDDISTEDRDAVTRATPLGRWGGPDEIAKAVLALIETEFITGETIRVDGGRHLY